MIINPLSVNLPKTIETKRLVLKPWVVTDVQELHELQQESADQFYNWYAGLLAQKQTTEDDIITYISQARSGFCNRTWIEYAAIEKASNRIIGAVSLHHLDWSVPKGRMGYFVRTSAGGNRFATEMSIVMTRLAIDKIGIKRLEIRVSTENAASSVIPRKLGYKFLTVFEKNKVGANGELLDLEIHVRFDTNQLNDLKIDWNY